MTTPPTFDVHTVYRITLPTDTRPEARLAIGAVYESGCVRFFDTLRERIVQGHIIPDPRRSQDGTLAFATTDGPILYFEPLNLQRYRDIVHEIDGQPSFQTTEDLQSFYRQMAGIS